MAVIVLFLLKSQNITSLGQTPRQSVPVIPPITCFAPLVLHPVPGGKLTAKILDKKGSEVPRAQYELEVEGEDFTFKFKKPHRSRSGRYTVVFSYDGADTEKDILVNFLGEF